MLGASHARYLADALNEYETGSAAIDGANRKHGSATVSATLEYTYVELADDLADAISSVCAKARAAHSSASGLVKDQIVIHTGHWDLSFAGPRRLIKEGNSLPKLFRAVEAIFDGTNNSPTVTDFIWLTAAPYPLCPAGAPGECDSKRVYRHNPAIAAANHHILDFAERLVARHPPSSSGGKLLTVIDFFSMVKPRLFFSEDAETACTNHYVCRVVWSLPGATIFTPGGMALFQALVQALAGTTDRASTA